MTTYKNPLQLAETIQRPEKPVIDDEFYSNAHKDGYRLKGNEARLGKGRINSLIDEYGLWNENSDYSKGYLAYIDPREFIRGTTSDRDSTTNEELKNPSDLDLKRINNESQTPFLDVDFDNKVILGHEGRHRLASFAKQGINRLPVVIRDRSSSFSKDHAAKKNFNGTLGSQLFYDDDKRHNINLNSDLIPLNYKNIVDLYRIFNDED